MNIIKLNTVDSTNNYAKALIQSGQAEHNTMIFALEQTAGRGLNENRWESKKGQNLMFSLIIKPQNVAPKDQFQISKAIALGVCNYLKSRLNQKDVFIKWPNDIYVGLNKICGTLIETSIIGNQISYAIAGIGVNINQDKFSEALKNPTSLKVLTKKEYDLDLELPAIFDFLNESLSYVYQNKYEELNNIYTRNLLFYNEFHPYQIQDKTENLKIIGVNEFGHLQVEDKAGKITEYGLKEIVYQL